MKYFNYLFFLVISIYRAKVVNLTEYNIIRPEQSPVCYYLGLYCPR